MQPWNPISKKPRLVWRKPPIILQKKLKKNVTLNIFISGKPSIKTTKKTLHWISISTLKKPRTTVLQCSEKKIERWFFIHHAYFFISFSALHSDLRLSSRQLFRSDLVSSMDWNELPIWTDQIPARIRTSDRWMSMWNSACSPSSAFSQPERIHK